MKTLHSKTLPIALIAMAASFAAAPAAFADNRREVRVAFAYNTADTAEHIYADLERTARNACDLHGARSLQIRKAERACVKEMVDEGVGKLQRSDIAALHKGGPATPAAGNRG